MNIKAVEKQIKDSVKPFRRKVIFDDFRGTIKTWKHDTPNFKSDVKDSKDFVIRAYVVEDGSMGFKKWLWLNAGTSKRWALMSPDWQSKTRPGVIKPGRGAGKVLIAGKRRMRQPRPGIKAREWTKLIDETRSPEFAEIMKKANELGLGKLYG